MNRDYFTKPIQDSRSQHDYGHTGPLVGMDNAPNWRAAMAWAVPTGVAFWGLLWIVWTMLP